MSELAPKKGRFGASFLRVLMLGRLAMALACALVWAPAAAFAVLFGSLMVIEQGVEWPLGLLIMAWGGGGVLGLMAYLAHAIGSTSSRFYAFLKCRYVTRFGLIWGMLAAVAFVLPAIGSSWSSETLVFRVMACLLLAVLIDSALILLFAPYCQRSRGQN